MRKVFLADATLCHLAGVGPEDPNTVGVRSDGSRFTLPGVDSINMWGLVAGVEKSSPRQELPLVIAHPMFNTTALIVGDFKLLLGPQTESYWQGPDFPNGTAPYGVNGENICDCGDDETLEGGCLFNIRKDPAETVDLAREMPDMLHSLKSRYLVLRATMLDQAPIVKRENGCKVAAHGQGNASIGKCPAPKEFIDMLHRNKGFVGPWLP